MKNKIETIAGHYTFDKQRTVFVEECAEAIQAVCKLERAAEKSTEAYSSAMEALISEVADVIIMAEQMRIYLGRKRVDNECRRKLDRQLRRISEEVET